MKIEVAEGPTGLLLIHVLGTKRLTCEAIYNRFLLRHHLARWILLVRASFCDESIIAQSVTPDGNGSAEILITGPSEISDKLNDLLESELARWLGRVSASHASA